jgi:hypothetical protein
LRQFGSEKRILDYVAENEIKRIVLLEDFVGTGTQARKAIEFAGNLRPASPIPVLVVPLVICPKAEQAIAQLNLPGHVTVAPVLRLPKRAFICEPPEGEEPQLLAAIRALASRTYLVVSDGEAPNNKKKPFGPLGYKATGGLVVMYSNAPDNTLPIIHWRSKKWKPLFPRHSRA